MVTSGITMNRIEQLVKAGLVERNQSPDDGRSFQISFTEKDFHVIDAAVTARVRTRETLESGLSKDERRALDALLKSIPGDFEQK